MLDLRVKSTEVYRTPKDRFWMVLNGVLSLSRSNPKIKDLVASFIDEANRSTLVRGVSDDRLEEAAQVTDWKIKDNMLLLTIESGRLVRATSGLLRVRKALAPLLGRELRIGVRDISVTALRVFIPLVVKPDEETIARVKSMKGQSILRRDYSLKKNSKRLKFRKRL
jgi:hypothetical protein